MLPHQVMASWPWSWSSSEWLAAAPVGAVILGAIGLRFASQQLKHARQLKELEHRPYVIVDLEFRRWLVMLTIRNISRTPARDCTLEFDQPLQVPRKKNVHTYEVFNKPIPMLAPGRFIQISLGEGHAFFDDDHSYPLRYEVTVKYSSLDGKTKYHSDPPCILDLKPFANAALEPEGVAEIAKSLREIRTHLNKVTSGSRIQVGVHDRDAVNRKDRREWLRLRFLQVRRDDGLLAAVRWLSRERQ